LQQGEWGCSESDRCCGDPVKQGVHCGRTEGRQLVPRQLRYIITCGLRSFSEGVARRPRVSDRLTRLSRVPMLPWAQVSKERASNTGRGREIIVKGTSSGRQRRRNAYESARAPGGHIHGTGEIAHPGCALGPSPLDKHCPNSRGCVIFLNVQQSKHGNAEGGKSWRIKFKEH
jgi:hypothetical protein